jgi:hypothetical protein
MGKAMALVAAGTTTAVTLPAGATMTFSGMGTHQTSPPGSNGAPSKQLVPVTSLAQTLGPLAVATTINLMAAANGPGVFYSLASSNPTKDTITQTLVSASRALTQADNGTIIPTAAGITLTLGAGLVNFSCIPLPATGSSVNIAFTGGATGNGAATTINRTRASNVVGFSILQDTGTDVYAVGGV